MIQLRSLAADWLNGHEPRKDYREYSRKVLSISILHEKVMICDGCVRHKHQSQSMTHPARVVGATDTQLFILRAQVRALCDSSSEVRKKSSVFGKADLEASDGEIPYPTLPYPTLPYPTLTLSHCIFAFACLSRSASVPAVLSRILLLPLPARPQQHATVRFEPGRPVVPRGLPASHGMHSGDSKPAAEH
jgi:hypothetical protein